MKQISKPDRLKNRVHKMDEFLANSTCIIYIYFMYLVLNSISYEHVYVRFISYLMFKIDFHLFLKSNELIPKGVSMNICIKLVSIDNW